MGSWCCLNWLGVSITLIVVYKLLDYLLRLPTVGKYTDRYILVTGCDTGFGQTFARRLDALGCHVFAGCLTKTGQQELVKTCSERLQTLDLDVTKHDSVLRALDFVKSSLPPGKGLWAVLNNAGIAIFNVPDEWLTIDEYKRIMNVNLYGTIDVTMTFLPLIKRSRGRIVNTSSVLGRFTLMGATPYCVSKYGVEAFTDNLRRSLRMYGCKASLIEPGGCQTNLTSKATVNAIITRCWDSAPAEIKEEFGEDYYHACLSFTDTFKDTCGTNFMAVIDAYQHAVFGRFPRARYAVDFFNGQCLMLITYLPEWLVDAVSSTARAIAVPAAVKKKIS